MPYGEEKRRKECFDAWKIFPSGGGTKTPTESREKKGQLSAEEKGLLHGERESKKDPRTRGRSSSSLGEEGGNRP